MKLTLNSYSTPHRRKQLVYLLIEKLKTSGTIRTTNWFYKSALKGRFSEVDSSYAREFATQMDSMITVLNRVYEDKWDFHLDPIFDGQKFLYFDIYVLIHFPEIDILNSENRTHKIKDLLVTFKIKDNGDYNFVPYELAGTRATLSYEEWFVGYNHSHLQANKPNDFSDVFYNGPICTGSGEINDVMATMWDAGYIEEVFEMFLFTLNTLVEWESLEGTPHIRMERVVIGGEARISDVSDSNVQNYFVSILGNIENFDVDFVFSENRYKIKQNNKFQNIIKNIIIDKMSANWSKLLVTKINEKYYGYSHPEILDLSDRFLNDNQEKPYIIVQNLVLEFEVEEYSGELPEINNYEVHPKILKYAARELEKQLYYKSVRKSTIEKYHQSINA